MSEPLQEYLLNNLDEHLNDLDFDDEEEREDFKKLMGDQMIEFYVHTSEARERDHFKAIAYTPPTTKYIDLNTTDDTPEESFVKILKNI